MRGSGAVVEVDGGGPRRYGTERGRAPGRVARFGRMSAERFPGRPGGGRGTGLWILGREPEVRKKAAPETETEESALTLTATSMIGDPSVPTGGPVTIGCSSDHLPRGRVYKRGKSSSCGSLLMWLIYRPAFPDRLRRRLQVPQDSALRSSYDLSCFSNFSRLSPAWAHRRAERMLTMGRILVPYLALVSEIYLQPCAPGASGCNVMSDASACAG